MKRKYAVAYMNYFDNDLEIKIVETEGSWKDALIQAIPQINQRKIDSIDDYIETAKEDAFNQEWLFDVKEIK